VTIKRVERERISGLLPSGSVRFRTSQDLQVDDRGSRRPTAIRGDLRRSNITVLEGLEAVAAPWHVHR